MRRSLVALALALAATGAVTPTAEAQRLEQIFERANERYAAGDYRGAIQDYELLVEAGIDDPDVSYNLANANGRLGQYGHAIRWFEHTLTLSPGDDDAERGLEQARTALGRRQADARGEATVETEPTFAESLVRPFSESTLAWVVLFVNVLFFGLLFAWRFVRAESARLALGITLPLTGLLLLASGAGLAIKASTFSPGEPGIVVAGEAELREGPDPRAEIRGSALEGERARIVDEDGGWVRIRLGGSRDGWVESTHVGTI